jgi:hypothetical protein
LLDIDEDFSENGSEAFHVFSQSGIDIVFCVGYFTNVLGEADNASNFVHDSNGIGIVQFELVESHSVFRKTPINISVFLSVFIAMFEEFFHFLEKAAIIDERVEDIIESEVNHLFDHL